MYGYNNYQYPTYVGTGLPDYRQQMQFPQQQPTQQQNTTQNNGMIWVQGEAGAKSYLIAPSSAVTLWDSEDKIFYIKSANASGMPSLQKFSYCEITDNSNIKTDTNSENISFDGSKFVTREEYEDLQNKIQVLETIINRNNNQQQQNKGGKNNG
jgi:hypothetical protein